VVQLEKQLGNGPRAVTRKLRAVSKAKGDGSKAKSNRAAAAAGPAPVRDKRYYTDEDLQRMFEVSKRTTARWRKMKMIGYLRAPGSQVIRYSRAQIEAFERSLEVKAKTGRHRN
jgi:hypothetical protein